MVYTDRLARSIRADIRSKFDSGLAYKSSHGPRTVLHICNNAVDHSLDSAAYTGAHSLGLDSGHNLERGRIARMLCLPHR
jgi:hypothetical protein